MAIQFAYQHDNKWLMWRIVWKGKDSVLVSVKAKRDMFALTRKIV